MPKQTYVPTEADRLTGQNVRALRRFHSETIAETIERSGLTFSPQSLSRVELGTRPLSLPDATKLAAHWNTIPDKIFAKPVDTPPTEQEWLGNDKPAPLFVVSGDAKKAAAEIQAIPSPGRQLKIDLDNPLTLDEYREQVWIPYLEARYSADLKAS